MTSGSISVSAGETCLAARHRCAAVVFDEPRAFVNANMARELAQLQRN